MTVHLVGAGPGAADLLTLRAARLLGEADIVVHDRLIGDEILDLIAPWAERIDVGKNPNGKSVRQERINRILIDAGRRAETVVRLKGGDPFVFGRGGEEAIDLRAAGIDVEVVPGVTSAIAGPAMAGIPVTHRGVSSGFTVLTAMQDPTTETSIDWEAAARLGTTLVILMGARRARELAEHLVEVGMDGDTPVAVITEATTAAQRVRHHRLADLGIERVTNPSVIVIGAVAGDPVLDPQDPTLLALLSDQPDPTLVGETRS